MQTQQTLSHRPTVSMPLFDAQQSAELARVSSKLEPLVLAFFASKKSGDEFHINELTRFVWRINPLIAADSPRRVMRELKMDGKLNYELISRSASLYKVAAMPESEVTA